MRDLTGKNILITGAARGLGRAYARHLAELGANIGITYRDLHSYAPTAEATEMTADNVLDEIRAYGVKAFGFQADVTDAEAMKKAAAAFVAEFGTIDAVICNAGGGEGPLSGAKPSEMDLEQLRKVVERNFFGTVHTISAVAPYMKEQGFGKIVTVASQVGVSVNFSGAYAHYAAAKAAIIQYTKSLAQDVGPYGVTANCVAPGDIATARLTKLFKEQANENRNKSIALRRPGTPDEVAGVMEFLVSDMSNYVSGTVIEVTGGVMSACVFDV